MDYNKLIEALETIQNTCHKERCEICPMGTLDGECLVILNYPSDWNITPPVQIIRVMQE